MAIQRHMEDWEKFQAQLCEVDKGYMVSVQTLLGLHESCGSGEFPLFRLQVLAQMRRALRAKNLGHLQVCQIKGDLVVLSDSQAAEWASHQRERLIGGLHRVLEVQKGVDPDRLDSVSQRKHHEVSVEITERTIAAVCRERKKLKAEGKVHRLPPPSWIGVGEEEDVA